MTWRYGGALIEDREFPRQKILESPLRIGDVRLRRCRFLGGVIAQYDDVQWGISVSEMDINDCRIDESVLHGVAFERVRVRNLRASRGLRFAACVFSEVSLSGRIPSFHTLPENSKLTLDVQKSFANSAQEFYRQAEWALDISEAELSDSDLSYIPGHLIRRDPSRQVLVSRAALTAADLNGLSDYASIVVERTKLSPFESVVWAVPKRIGKSQGRIKAIEELRDRGIVEGD